MVKTRVVFLGTPEFAAVTLSHLLAAAEIQVTGVVTQPDRPAGRGRKLKPPPVKVLALESEVALLQPERIRGNAGAIGFLERARPDLLAVAAFGQILPRSFFDWPRYGSINVHASLLPKFRGASPIVQAIVQGEKETGVTIMKIDEGLDTGATLTRRRTPIEPEETAGELERRLAELGGRLLVETIGPYVRGELALRPQDHSQASHAPRIRKAEGRIDWGETALAVHNRIRGFNPWPTASTTFRGDLVKLWRSRLPIPTSDDRPPGTILGSRPDSLLVQCGGRSILPIAQLQPANRKRMTAVEFVNGFGVSEGEAFL